MKEGERDLNRRRDMIYMVVVVVLDYGCNTVTM